MATDLSDAVRHHLAALDKSDYPRDGICQHHGVYLCVGNNQIQITNHGPYLLIIAHRNDNKWELDQYGRRFQLGYYKREHESIAESIQEGVGAGIVKRWNGADGDTTQSLVFDRDCPASLATAIKNYHKLPNVFDLSDVEKAQFKAFRGWLKSALGGADNDR